MSSAPEQSRSATCTYLPDLCAPVAVLAVVLGAELLAIALALARQNHWVDFFADLGSSSLVLQWLSLTSAGVMCLLRPHVSRLGLQSGTLLVIVVALANVLFVSEALYWIGYAVSPALDGWLPADHWFFSARNVAIAGIIIGVLLRYFYVSDQWQRNVQREAEARIHALQARIRPHFLFNSMNTIASLIRSQPAAAEQAVEDLAELFRASLGDAGQRIALGDELEIARVYERMEQQRLGERLRVDWQLDGLPLDAMIPSLTLQPLLENAIYHGIEPLAEPGVVQITGRREQDMLYISIRNPRSATGASARDGFHIAIDNIRERLLLAFGPGAGLTIDDAPGEFRVTVSLPYQPRTA